MNKYTHKVMFSTKSIISTYTVDDLSGFLNKNEMMTINKLLCLSENDEFFINEEIATWE